MPASPGIHWVRILIGGFLAEVAVIILVIPVALRFGQRPLLYLAPALSFIMCLLFGIWVARGVTSRFVLHGILVGLVATLIYVALTRAQPEPLAYWIAHGLKLLGGALGGLLASRRSSPASAPIDTSQ